MSVYPSKTPLIDSLENKIWNRYLNHKRFDRDLEASIRASLTECFDFRKYLTELPYCPNLREEHPDLRLLPSVKLKKMEREEAMRLIEHEIGIVLHARIRRRDEARAHQWASARRGQHVPA